MATVHPLTAAALAARRAPIIAVASDKGGTGKTTISMALAAPTLPHEGRGQRAASVLVDLDGSAGGARGRWGYRGSRRAGDHLTLALHDANDPHHTRPPRAPRPLSGAGEKCDLIPGDRTLSLNTHGFDVGRTADALTAWATDLHHYPAMVIDTPPRANQLTYAAIQAADLTVVPVLFGTGELAALEELLTLFHGRGVRWAILPNMVPVRTQTSASGADARLVDEFEAIAAQHDATLLPEITFSSWWRRRRRRQAPTLLDPSAVDPRRLTAELRALADAVWALLP